jgi:hypothetical protein
MNLQKRRLKGRKSFRAGMNDLVFKYLVSVKFLLVMLMTLFSSSIEGLMGLWEEQSLYPFLQGTRAR